LRSLKSLQDKIPINPHQFPPTFLVWRLIEQAIDENKTKWNKQEKQYIGVALARVKVLQTVIKK
jgi:hypothetical protein